MADPRLGDLGDRLGIVLRDPEAIQQAFVHSSYFNENPNAVSGHNERLEFLGDAVIGLIVSRLLYERFPDEDEGLSPPGARRSSTVMPARVAPDRAGPIPPARPGRVRSRRGHPPIGPRRGIRGLAGAIFLSEGVDVTREWLQRLFEAPLPGAGDPEPPKSAKSRLQEWSQREHRIKPHYELVSTTGPDHDQTFTVAAVLRGERIALGHGSSRQRAEEQAAGAALDSLSAAGIEGGRLRELRLHVRDIRRSHPLRLRAGGERRHRSQWLGRAIWPTRCAGCWASSRTALRTRRADDVIFAGSQQRQPQGGGDPDPGQRRWLAADRVQRGDHRPACLRSGEAST